MKSIMLVAMALILLPIPRSVLAVFFALALDVGDQQPA
jgi:hypothetical protein